jgi:NADH:ubiquinone oxidoreductase subunit F (NADH-binding)
MRNVDNELIAKIEKAGLVGRGGAGYSTAKKWQEVGQAPGDKKFVVANASEGEIGLFKDIYILKNHPDMVVKAMVLALDHLGSKDAFFNLNKTYFRQVGAKLKSAIKQYNDKGYNIQIFVEEPSYIGGEETALLNAIEGKRTEPRSKPPYPSIAGLYGAPTIINNVETLYNIACVADGIFEHKRFYCISAKNKRVYHLPDDWDIEKVLKETGNYPDFEFFVQIGGGASGTVLNQDQIKGKLATGAGSIEVFNAKKTDPRKLLLRWLEFYQRESCGKCAPCRVGTYELYRMVKESKEIPWKEMFDILETMEITSFCALGRSVIEPIRTYYSNVLKLQ